MRGKEKRISGILFISVLLLGMIGGILLPDKVVSESEKRKLVPFPEFTWSSVGNGDYSEGLETYFLEQFPGRDLFRTLKAEFDTIVLGKIDSNGYVKREDQILEIQTSYDEAQVVRAAEQFQEISRIYFMDVNVYYGVIPDKNYFVEDIPQYDYESVKEILEESFSEGTAISLWDTLELDSYYSTDLHIRQEAFIPLVNTLLTGMGKEDYVSSKEQFQSVLATDEFYGGYSGASGYATAPDCIYYLENTITQDARVYDYETNETVSVYQLDKLGGMDDYDLFLGGARALLTIQNVHQNNGEKLLIFRDSFGSSITPLLLSAYEEVTLVDLRYVSADYAMQLLESREGENFRYDDVLFLYQAEVLYNSNSMR